MGSWKNVVVPPTKLEDLDEDSRKLYLAVIHLFAEDIIKKKIVGWEGLTLKEVEKAALGLAEKGFLRMWANDKGFGMEMYDYDKEDYVKL